MTKAKTSKVAAAKTLSDAEHIERIQAWSARVPVPGIRLLPTVNVPALAWLQRALPDDAATRTLAAAYSAALRLTPLSPVLQQADAVSLAVLRGLPLAEKETLAAHFGSRKRWAAGGAGAVLGFAGVAGLVVDAPALLVFSLATVIRIGQCYGEAVGPGMAAALFALASADTADEKALAWRVALDTSAPKLSAKMGMDDAALRDGLERAAEREFAKAAMAGSLRKLSLTLVRRLGARRVAAVLPVIGALAGGLVNARFVGQLAEAAQMVFAARSLEREQPLALTGAAGA